MVRCQNRTESYIAGSMYFFTTRYINKTESLYEVTYLPRKVSAPNKPRSQYVVRALTPLRREILETRFVGLGDEPRAISTLQREKDKI